MRKIACRCTTYLGMKSAHSVPGRSHEPPDEQQEKPTSKGQASLGELTAKVRRGGHRLEVKHWSADVTRCYRPPADRARTVRPSWSCSGRRSFYPPASRSTD